MGEHVMKKLAKPMLFAAAFIWGSSFFIMKDALDALPVQYLLAIRFTAGAVLLCGPNEQPLRFGSTAALVAQLYVLDVLLTEFSRRDPEGAEQCRQSVGKALAKKVL